MFVEKLVLFLSFAILPPSNKKTRCKKMVYVNENSVFYLETGVTYQEIEKLVSYGVVLKFLLIHDDVTKNWFIKVSSGNGSSGYLLNSRERMKRYASLDTAVNQLSALAPNFPISIHP